MSFMCPLFLYHVTRNFRRIKIHKSTQKSFLHIYFSYISSFSHFCTTSFIFSQTLVSQISKNRRNSESYWPRKFPAIQYSFHQYLLPFFSNNSTILELVAKIHEIGPPFLPRKSIRSMKSSQSIVTMLNCTHTHHMNTISNGIKQLRHALPQL